MTENLISRRTKMKEKSTLRRTVLKKRSEMSPEENQKLSRIICEKALRLNAYKEAKTVYVYVAFQGEVDTKNLIRDAWKCGKRVAVPKIHGDEMIFCRLESFTQLTEGYKGIPEPTTAQEKDETALVIMPGAVFDEKRNRIGYGKGFYDRFLEKNPRHRTVALAFDLQVMKEDIPHEKTDLCPDAVVTQTRIIR